MKRSSFGLRVRVNPWVNLGERFIRVNPTDVWLRTKPPHWDPKTASGLTALRSLKAAKWPNHQANSIKDHARASRRSLCEQRLSRSLVLLDGPRPLRWTCRTQPPALYGPRPLPASRTPTPTAVTVWHTAALSPPRGALCVLPKSVSLLLSTSLYNKRFIAMKKNSNHCSRREFTYKNDKLGPAHSYFSLTGQICLFERRVCQHSSLKKGGGKRRKLKDIYQKVKEDHTTIYIFMYTYMSIYVYICMYVCICIYIWNQRCWATRLSAQLTRKRRKKTKK